MTLIKPTHPSARLSLVLAIITCGALSTTVRADDHDLATKTVRFDDLNIDNAAGAAVLYHRIQAAAREVCRPVMSTDLHQVAIERACLRKAVDNAVWGVNSVALHEIRFGRDLHFASR